MRWYPNIKNSKWCKKYNFRYMGENKMSKIFYNDDLLIKFESEEQWDESVMYLSKKLCSCSDDKSILFRLAAQCWYVLTFWDCDIPKERLDRVLFERELETTYNIARKKYWNDSDCLWLFGYFMCINQMDFLFVSENLYEVESEGNRLICESYSNDPSNDLAKILYLVDNGTKSKYIAAIKAMRKKINEYFSKQSAVELYFSEIFTNGIN